MLFNNFDNKISQIFSKIYNKINKINRMSCFEKIFVIFILLLFICIIYNYFNNKEGYQERKQFIIKSGTDVYDDFYVNMYDDLVYNELKNKYEVGEIINSTEPTSHSILLDIGSGTGHHLNMFNDVFSNITGLDISPAMIKMSQKNYPTLNYKLGDALDNMVFESNSFTHITCLYFTIYYMKDKKQFFQNVYDWLMPGGYLVIHLVDRDIFDPIVPAGDPTLLISPQKYAKKRITNSVVMFDDYEYKSNFEFVSNESNESNALLKEIIRNIKTGSVRQNDHTIYMSTQKEILSQARNVGFIMLKQIDMKECKYDAQYLYVLQKPN